MNDSQEQIKIIEAHLKKHPHGSEEDLGVFLRALMFAVDRLADKSNENKERFEKLEARIKALEATASPIYGPPQGSE